MIKSVTLHKGRTSFTHKLYKHSTKDVTFNFTDGVNVITGRNGAGKSVLLKIIKTNCAIQKNSTYPEMIHPSDICKGFFSGEYYTVPEFCAKELKNHELPVSSLDWDGSMVHYLTPEFFNPHNVWERLDSPLPKGRELYSGAEALLGIISKNSAGEKSIGLLNKLYELHTNYDPPLKRVNDTWAKADTIYQDWVKSLPKDGKPTLLIDELDHHLDIDNQKVYWDFINHLAIKWQVIVVSHSIFAFIRTDVNHIPLDKKYLKNVQQIFKQ